MTKNIKLLLFASLITTVITSCRSKNIMTMNITEPAPIQIGSHITKVGILNRSIPSSGNSVTSDIEKILSAEGLQLDSLGAAYCLDGLFDELESSNVFTEVKLVEGDSSTNYGLSIFPASLTWEQVENICKTNNIDALYVLSFYDTDTKVDYSTVPVEVNSPVGKVKTLEHQARIYTLIKLGFRIYDPSNKQLIEEFYIEEQVLSSGRGINPFKAVEAIIGRKQAVLQASKAIGQQYGLRVLPYTARIARKYYVRGNQNFKTAKRRAQTGNWDGAAELWYSEVDNSKRKLAGRACYNMAISSEINGDLETAIQWATKAYEEYNNKLALDYVNVLKYRQERNKLLYPEITP